MLKLLLSTHTTCRCYLLLALHLSIRDRPDLASNSLRLGWRMKIQEDRYNMLGADSSLFLQDVEPVAYCIFGKGPLSLLWQEGLLSILLCFR